MHGLQNQQLAQGEDDNLLVPLLAVSSRSKLNDMRRSSLADTKRGEGRLGLDVQYVACVQEGFGGRVREGFEACERLFDRGVEADGVDGQVLGEVCQGWGERVGGAGEVNCCGCDSDVRSKVMS